jgi:hypothetical protein
MAIGRSPLAADAASSSSRYAATRARGQGRDRPVSGGGQSASGVCETECANQVGRLDRHGRAAACGQEFDQKPGNERVAGTGRIDCRDVHGGNLAFGGFALVVATLTGHGHDCEGWAQRA